jgi:hypothetical protein
VGLFAATLFVRRVPGLALSARESLPTRWFIERTFRVDHRVWELACNQVRLTNPFHECRQLLELGTVMLMRIQNAHRELQFSGHDPHRFSEVRIVRNEHCHFELLRVRVAQQVRGQVDSLNPFPLSF